MPELGRVVTVGGDFDGTSEGDLHDEVFFDTPTPGSRRRRHDMLDTMVGSAVYLLTQ